jgi:hypothetical protein
MLRPEAQPLDWNRLDQVQKAAVDKITALMVEAIDSPQPAAAREAAGITAADTFHIDFDRSSRIALLSGDRGTGKTSVLLSIKHLSTSSAKIDDSSELTERFARLAEHAVWLEPIDMEPLAEPTNLLAAVLARIGDAAQAVAPLGEGNDYRGLLEVGSGYHGAIQELHRLETNVALAWDGNLSSRAAQLDLDSFAVEVMRAERARLRLNHSLKQVLDQLAHHVFRGRRGGATTGPLFILPVDDFDLNPLRCLDFLRVLRMVSVRRLFTLVLGDIRMVQTVFGLKLSGEFARLAGCPGEHISSLADEVAANAVRKLLPPGQRVHLGYMALDEALDFKPRENEDSLHRILERCPLWVNSPYHGGYQMTNLKDFFIVAPHPLGITPQSDEGSPSTVGPGQIIQNSVYSGKLMFCISPRCVADMWQELHRLSTPGRKTTAQQATSAPQPGTFPQVRAIVEVFANHFLRMISEDPVFTPHMRQALAHACHKTPEGYWELDTSVFTMRADTGSAFSFKVDPGADIQLVNQPITQKIRAVRFHGWLLRVREASNPKRQTTMKETTGAALQVFHDLVCLANQGTKRKAIWMEMIRRRHLSWEAPATEWRSEGRSSNIKWPGASWCSFREFDYLFEHWNRVINWLDDPNQPHFRTAIEKLEAVVFGWIDVCFMTLEPWKRRESSEPNWPAGFEGTKEERWQRLIGNLAQSASRLYQPQKGSQLPVEHPHLSQYRAQDWLTQWAVYLMPETIGTALQPTLNQFLTKPKDATDMLWPLYQFCQDRHRAIQDHRAKKLAYLLARGMQPLVQRLYEAPLPGFFHIIKDEKNIFQPDTSRVRALAAELQDRPKHPKRAVLPGSDDIGPLKR